MNEENNISQELQSMGSPLAGLPRTMPYSVPGGYFEQFPSLVKSTIRELDEPEVVPAFGKKLPYSVPPGYFENLAGHIVAAAAAPEMPAGMSKEVPFKAPANYFETLPGTLLSKAKAADAGTTPKIIEFKRPHVFRSVQLAAAAIFILFIGIGSYITFFSARIVNPEVMLAAVTNNEINEYVQGTYRIDASKIQSNNEINSMQLDNKEIIEYLDETGWDIVE
jgi:hypothetical protein